VWQNDKLLYVEYGGPGIKVWDGKRAAAYWQSEHCGASGLIPYERGHLLVACYDANTVVELDDLGNLIRTIDRDSAGKRFTGPNDFAADGVGGIYFSASGVYDPTAPITGAVLYLSPAGRVTEVADTIHYSNWLTVSKDGKSLLVS
jgi:gluconolactonase